MNKYTKISLIIAGIIVLSVVAYYVYKKMFDKNEDVIQDAFITSGDRPVKKRTNNLIRNVQL